MANRKTSKPVDPAKLRPLLESKGKLADISRALGYGSNQMTNILSQATITEPARKLLELTYGIKYEDYKPTAKEKAPSKKEQLLEALVEQMATINNNQLKIYELLQTISDDIQVWK